MMIRWNKKTFSKLLLFKTFFLLNCLQFNPPAIKHKQSHHGTMLDVACAKFSTYCIGFSRTTIGRSFALPTDMMVTGKFIRKKLGLKRNEAVNWRPDTLVMWDMSNGHWIDCWFPLSVEPANYSNCKLCLNWLRPLNSLRIIFNLELLTTKVKN